jgi:porin
MSVLRTAPPSPVEPLLTWSGRPIRALRVGLLVAQFASVAHAQAPSAQPAAQAAPEDWLERSELTGDWGGARTTLASEGGTTLEISLTQFFHWVPEGDDDRGFDYGGKLDVKSKTALGRWLWENSSIGAHIELRYGDTPLSAGGTLIPTSAALLFPESDGTEAKLSSLYFTQLFAGRYVLQAGRFNALDLYSAHPFTGGEGIDRFMNLALVAPPVSARTVPPVFEGVLFTVLRGATPAITVGVIESTDEGFFDNGATFMWSVSPPWRLSDKPGGIAFGGELSSFEGTSLDQSPWAFIPSSPIPLAQEQGTWTLNVTVDQILRMHPADPTKGWGFFGMLGISDGNPSFLDVQAFAGLGGAAPFQGRSRDSWGLGYFVNGVSGDLEDTLDPFIRTRDEHGLELFYSWAPVGWSRVTADLQVIDPFLVRSETRAFFAIRWKVIF